MTRRTRTALLAALALVAAAVPLTASTSAAAAPDTGTTRTIEKAGTAAYQPPSSGGGQYSSVSGEIAQEPEIDEADAPAAGREPKTDRSLAREHHVTSRPAAAPTASSARVAAAAAAVSTGFDGLNARDQRTANGGNQFTVEPPDQALCVGPSHIVEAVNDVLRVRAKDGTPSAKGVQDLNTFFGYPAQFNRTTGEQGPFVTDPSCLFDPTTGEYFLVVLTLEVVPSTGEFTGDNHLDIAVTSNPTGSWDIYRVDVTDDGRAGTPVHPNCPCIGDYPHIGVDANGFYITTNEYPFFTEGFNSAQIYAFSKEALAAGRKRVSVTQFDTTNADQGLNGFTIWPAQSPTTGDYETAENGTAYFLSSNAAEEATGTDDYVSTSIVTWSLTNTGTVGSRSPSLALHDDRVVVDQYSLPPPSDQKAGTPPLLACLNDPQCSRFVLGKTNHIKETEGPLDSNDTRMQQVTYAGGLLYGALDTAADVGGATKAGIAYYVVEPTPSAASTLHNQGTLAVANNNVTYPAIGITAGGAGVLSFTLAGADHFPTAAFTTFDATNGAGAVQVAQEGQSPQDGFTEYRSFGDPPRPRWGDYGATAVDGSTIWVAAEYIAQPPCSLDQYIAGFGPDFGDCGDTRVPLANWGTRISQITP
jgi:hypothetical protein